MNQQVKQQDTSARRAAQRMGLVAKKSRRQHHPLTQQGGFMLVDPTINAILAGADYGLTAQDVIDICNQ